jgi:glycosyltransferase involved in cell wall biosynthesis
MALANNYIRGGFSGSKGFNGPLISVLKPMYNAEEYVGDVVMSVLRQTHTNWELTVIDNGSTDRGIDVLRRLAGNMTESW